MTTPRRFPPRSTWETGVVPTIDMPETTWREVGRDVLCLVGCVAAAFYVFT